MMTNTQKYTEVSMYLMVDVLLVMCLLMVDGKGREAGERVRSYAMGSLVKEA